jgi:thioredoxin reductase
MEGSVKAFFNSEVIRITPDTIEIKTPAGNEILENDFVLAMTGYQPPFDFMKAMGITFHEDEYHTPVYDEETMESNVTDLYLAGVVCGGLKTNKWFIENSRVHAEIIIKDLQRKVATK